MEEVFLGGVAACGAGFFTNPLEVVKTRMQLQGELKARGHYAVHYRGVFHAFITIATKDGLFAIQKGLVPALWYQFFMNGARLGTYQTLCNKKINTNADGSVSVVKSILCGAFSGTLGAVVGSPLYMVKTHLQAKSVEEIAVGHQHKHESMWTAFRQIYNQYGIKGLWRGVTGAVPRVTVGSGAQLATFSKACHFVEGTQIFKKDSILNALIASMMSGVVVVICMTPFDVISTRLYNQGIDKHGKGLFYDGFLDCFTKMFKSEGLWGFYKGWAPSLFRLGPHTVLSLVLWRMTRNFYASFKEEKA
ncbi:solute carrier family 25 member 35 [Lingula anatina]|uniref:Solute carrier family 25 member 35 n=1 Tax=Lingula anatina TaxID=7574 RepID=A0A1S3K2T3_LINAN|nr:solute carrier family 25 member 35 [Lingula anatina]|eukprot:XP_013416950.1 solute carrier family 25 member 35 [Lingula anatina]